MVGNPAVPAESEVGLRSGLVSIRAEDAPLTRLLDEFGRQTGASISYLGGTPSVAVTLVIHGKAPADALAELLSKAGLNYAVDVDQNTQRVRSVVIVSGEPQAVVPAPAPPAEPGFEPPNELASPEPVIGLDEDGSTAPGSAQSPVVDGMVLPAVATGAEPAASAPPTPDPSGATALPGEHGEVEPPDGMQFNTPPPPRPGRQPRPGNLGKNPPEGMKFDVPPPPGPGPGPQPDSAQPPP
jgi:hypothetical protein